MKSILNERDKEIIINRIKKLSPEGVKLWGKMDLNQMLCHTSDQIRMATGTLKTKFVGNLILKTIVKRLILVGAPTPKGKIETANELSQEKEGTPPIGFDEDLKQLVKLIEEFGKSYPNKSKIVHPAFGPLTKKQWGRLIYIHMDHHLKQFGV